MAFEVGTLSARLKLDTSEFEAGLNRVKGKINELNQSATSGAGGGGLVNYLKESKSGFEAMAVAGTAGLASLGFGLKSVVDSYTSAEMASTRLSHVLKTSRGATDEMVNSLKDQARALEEVGVVSSSNIMLAQGTLATFDLQRDSIEKMTPAILDYAVAEKGASVSGQELTALTNGLAQALNGNYSSLTRIGFVMDDATKKMISQGTEAERVEGIVKVLNSTYKDANEAMRQTAGGGIQALKNEFTAIKESIGTALLPSITSLVSGLSGVTSSFKKVAQIHPEVVTGFTTMAITATGLMTVLGVLGKAIPAISRSLQGLGTTAAGSATGWVVLITAVATLIAIMQSAFSQMNKYRSQTIENNSRTRDTAMVMKQASQATGEQKTKLLELAQKTAQGKTTTEEFAEKVSGLGKEMGKAGGASKNMADAASEASATMRKAIEEQNEGYRESLKEMVVRHAEAIAEIREQVQNELDYFKQSQEDKQRSYDRQVSDMEESHSKTMKSLEESLAGESDIDDKREANYRKKLDDKTRAHEKKIREYEDLLKKELLKTDTYDQRKVDNLKEKIAEEQDEYDLYIKELTEGYNADVEADKKKEEAKKANVQKRIQEELAEYNKRKSRLEEDRARELSRDKEEHNKKLEQLKKKLAEEDAIQKKYASDFKTFKDAVLDDDITKLKENHSKRLSEIAEQYEKEKKSAAGATDAIGGSFGNMAEAIEEAYKDAMEGLEPPTTEAKSWLETQWEALKLGWKTQLEMAGLLWKSTIEAFKIHWEGFKNWMWERLLQIKGFFVSIFQSIGTAISGSIRAALNFIISKIERMINGLTGVLNNIKNKVPGLGEVIGDIGRVSIPRLASGTKNFPGGLSVVGEMGAELVNLPRGSEVIPSDKTSRILNSGGGDIVFNNSVFTTSLDIRDAIREAFAERELQGLV